MCAPTLSDITRSISILEYFRTNWLENVLLGCSIERWLENKTWSDVLEWLEEKPEHYESDLGLFIRYSQEIGLDKYGAAGQIFSSRKFSSS